MKAPFPWFGGKSRVAHIVWERFGDVVNYVEPFAGSLAVLLQRPHEPRNETVNDLDCYLANFWRALREDPEGVAEYADAPVNEADLHARHHWLHDQEKFRKAMHSDPDHYDAKIAGWWVWGISVWIGDNWCRAETGTARPNLQAGGKGVAGDGKRPMLWRGGPGVHRQSQKRPDIRKGGRGVHSERSAGAQQMPDVSGDGGASGKGIQAKRARNLYGYFEALSDRLRRVRVCCGQWDRILGPSPTVHIGTTAVFLDPPYGVDDRDKVYNHDGVDIAGHVRAWCLEHGPEKRLRIALCGYAGEHDQLESEGWLVVPWKAAGGYGARGKRKMNAFRERIWFSPGCIDPSDSLFAGLF